MKREFQSTVTFAVAIAALVLVVSACSLTKGKAQGEAAAEKFHKQFNSSKYNEIYKTSSGKFKEAVSRKQFEKMVEAIDRKLGKIENSKQVNWFVKSTLDGTTVELNFDVEFTKAKGTEQLIFLLNGDKAELFAFYVNSPAFLE